METKETLLKYGIGFNKRFNRKQKNNFCNEIGKDFKETGYAVKGVVAKKKRQVSMNLMVGDVTNAKVLVVANYDTPQHNFGKQINYYPFKGTNSFTSSFVSTYTPLILSSVLLLFIVINVVPKIDFKTNLFNSCLIVASIFLLVSVSYVLTKGVANKVNFNRNTSGVLTALKLASIMDDKDKNKVAFVLTDNGCTNHAGDYMLHDALPTTLDQRLVIILDCVGVGDMFAIGYRDASKNESKELAKAFKNEAKTKLCPNEDLRYTSFSFYIKGLLVTRGKEADTYLTIENTASNDDTLCDTQAIDDCADALKKYISRI